MWITDKDLDRSSRERMNSERIEAQRNRQKMQNEQAMERTRLQHKLKQEALRNASQLEKTTAIGVLNRQHELEPEIRELNYKDLIRESNLTLQKLKVELALQDQVAQNEHDRQIDYVYQSTMMEITKESARTLDEKNKAVTIAKKESELKAQLETLQHYHDSEKSHQDHQQALEKKEQDHRHQLERDVIQSQLHQSNFTHEEITRLAVRVLARQLGLEEHQVSEEQIKEWVDGWENEF